MFSAAALGFGSGPVTVNVSDVPPIVRADIREFFWGVRSVDAHRLAQHEPLHWRTLADLASSDFPKIHYSYDSVQCVLGQACTGWHLSCSLAEHSRLHCGHMRRLLQPSYECFGMHLGRFELVPVPVAPSRLPVPLALSTRRPTAVDTFTGISQILLRLYSGDLAECFRLHRVYSVLRTALLGPYSQGDKSGVWDGLN